VIDPRATISDGHALCGACHGQKAQPIGERQRAASERAVPARMPVTMDACVSCHLPADARAQKAAHPWSVAARFQHDQNHRGACEGCHRKPDQADLVRPTMEGCAACHDGAKAFKATGFGCARCHGPRTTKKDNI
jgi:hypothetical protein